MIFYTFLEEMRDKLLGEVSKIFKPPNISGLNKTKTTLKSDAKRVQLLIG